MAIYRTIGGDRLGSGNRMKQELHEWHRSTHNLSEKLKTTMAAGTLVPILNKVVLPNDHWKVKVEADVMTKPTNGPLFGSFKLQIDYFFAPYRLYIAQLHNNKLGIGLKMSDIKLPLASPKARGIDANNFVDNQQVNPSCVLSYLGLRGLGRGTTSDTNVEILRRINATPLLSYIDIYKNYYANKQEDIAAYIHREPINTTQAVTTVQFVPNSGTTQTVPFKGDNSFSIILNNNVLDNIRFNFSAGSGQGTDNLVLIVNYAGFQQRMLAKDVFSSINSGTNSWEFSFVKPLYDGHITLLGWDYATSEELPIEPQVKTCDLKLFDEYRENLLTPSTSPKFISSNIAPWNKEGYLKDLFSNTGTGVSLRTAIQNNQEGLFLKTYQADIYNVWLKTDFINQITNSTAVVTTGGQFTLDQLVLAKKKWEHLNRLVVSGGTYRDYLEVAYGARDSYDFEIPMYLGGMSKEIVFQEVVSTADTERPLGSLAGKGIPTNKKGGYFELKANEFGTLLGIASITPRIDYSQGNDFAIDLQTMDDFHKPAMDGIGFMDLITDNMAWFDTKCNNSGVLTYKSAGKVPAWLHYQTSVNRALGNFAEPSEMWMTLNRRYEFDVINGIKDLTTYIDPKKFNDIWAVNSRDAQNFWLQVENDIEVRRAMSARQIPTL